MLEDLLEQTGLRFSTGRADPLASLVNPEHASRLAFLGPKGNQQRLSKVKLTTVTVRKRAVSVFFWRAALPKPLDWRHQDLGRYVGQEAYTGRTACLAWVKKASEK